MIWEVSLQPRLIKLENSTYVLDIRHPPTSAYLLGGDYPYEHFTMDDAQRPPEPYLTGHLFPTSMVSPAALAVNRESRQCLLSLGYRSWALEHPRFGTKQIMWCPSVDTILFPTRTSYYDGGFPNYNRRFLNMFMQHYPTQAAQCHRVALPSSYWSYDRTFAADIGLFLSEFTNLEEIIMVLNEKHERTCVNIEKSLAMPGHVSRSPWIVPKAIEKSLRKSLTTLPRSTYGKENKKFPSVRVIWSERDITSWSSGERELALRCYPCERFPS